MRHQDGEVIQTIGNLSGNKRLQVILRPDGTAQFVGRAIAHDPDTGEQWMPTYQSGLYPNASEALGDAQVMLGWPGGGA